MHNNTTKAEVADLNQLFNESVDIDKEIRAEQRSNILLVAGEHYAKLANKAFRDIRARADLSNEQKIRLTKNHIQNISKKYVNYILSGAPDVTCTPVNEVELQDKKVAELNESVRKYIYKKHKFKEKTADFVNDFVNIGEVIVKIYWDKTLGGVKGYKQAKDEMGQPVFDAMGQPVAGDEPVMYGDFCFERWFGFNMFREKSALSMEESPFVGYQKMSYINELKIKYQDDEEKLKFIQAEQNTTYQIFDAQSSAYTNSKDMALIKEIYYRPCLQYPNGYYYIFTSAGILEEGELPFGIWPIITAPYEKYATSPRGRSPIKHMRPYQVEINRSGSKIAEHQITLGDDKIVSFNGATLSQGAILPGIRGINVDGGMPPTILPGRDGSQYLGYMTSQITELYQVMGMPEMFEDKAQNVDVYAMLMRSASQKKIFSTPIERIEHFLQDLWGTTLELAKHYFDDEMLIPMVGKSENVNIVEFKKQPNTHFMFTVEPRANDVESQMGKQLVMNQILQYAGSQLTKDEIGVIIQDMPFSTKGGALSDMTLRYTIVENTILALDRGEVPVINENMDHAYMIQKLVSRQLKSDYNLVPDEYKLNYGRQIMQHEQYQATIAARINQSKSEFIPTSGALITCDMYARDPVDPTKSKRIRIPYDALQDLINRLDAQRTPLEQLDSLPPGASADTYQMATSQGNTQQGAPVQPSEGGNLPLAPG